MDATQILDREFLELRAKILEVAASFDRMDRAAGDIGDSDEFNKLRAGLQLVLEGKDRAQAVQQLFSNDYHPQWRSQFGI